MGVNKWLIGLAGVLLSACIEVPVEADQRQHLPVLQGALITGNTIDQIHLGVMNGTSLDPLTGALVSIHTPDGQFSLQELGGGIYGHPDLEVFASATYLLQASKGEVDLMAEAQTPAAFGFTIEPSTILNIDPDQPFESVSVLDWADGDDVEFLLTLEVLESNPIEIPFNGTSGGRFEIVFAEPQPESGTLLLASDFKYYGQHRLTIFAVPSAYSALFNPAALSDRQEVPFLAGSVKGGYGYLAGITPLYWEFEVE